MIKCKFQIVFQSSVFKLLNANVNHNYLRNKHQWFNVKSTYQMLFNIKKAYQNEISQPSFSFI